MMILEQKHIDIVDQAARDGKPLPKLNVPDIIKKYLQARYKLVKRS